MTLRTWIGFGIAAGLMLSGCEKKEEAPAPKVEAPKVVEPVLTEEERQAKLLEELENQPEPELNPQDRRETYELLRDKGRTMVRSVQDERFQILQQMSDLKFDEKDTEQKEAAAVRANLVELLETYTIGNKPEEYDKAGTRLCALVDELHKIATPLWLTNEEELAKVNAQLKELEQKQEAGGKVATKDYEKLESQQKVLSAKMLTGKYAWFALRPILSENFLLADYGPRRAQLDIRDCLLRDNMKEFPFELADKERAKVLSRSKWYRLGGE